MGERATLRLSAKMRMITLSQHAHKGFFFLSFFNSTPSGVIIFGWL